MFINSSLRSLPQQYLLYRWQRVRCGIEIAAAPGLSNHHGALAIDIESNAAWRSSLQAEGFAWLGSGDPVHFDYVGGGTTDIAIFVEGAVKAGKAAAKAAELFDLIEKFAGYGFNKSHAAAYALLAVQTAYLKAIYPTEFITALLTIEKEDTERLSRYIADARSMGIQILPPDVNESDMDFSIVSEGVIRFGLSAVKNVGEGGVEGILEARKKSGPFKDLFDFVSRIESGKVNKRLCEALIQSGAFDSMGESTAQLRGSYLATVEKALEWASSMAAKKAEGQFSLFGDSTAERAESAPRMESPIEAPSSRQLLDWEKELLGIYLTGSPLDKYANRAKAAGALAVFDLREKAPKSIVTVAVVVQEIREVRVKKGRRAGELMGIAKLEDPSGQI
jgi:DNA polymerase-3 subunit alpha